LGPYRLAELIDEGGSAEVYRVDNAHTGQALALKILKQSCCSDEFQRARFIEEGRTALALKNPNIVAASELDELDGAPCILMELLAGGSLKERLAGGQTLPAASAIRTATHIASALAYAHSRGIIHLDLKPTNILFTEDGATAKLSDFGIARIGGNEKSVNRAQEPLMATPRYMSPEQATATAPDERSDLFSLGAILYEMLTGRKAFDSDSLEALIEQVKHQQVMPITSPELPPQLRKIVARLLEKKPAERFTSAGELTEALAELTL